MAVNFGESSHYYHRAACIPGRSLTRSKAPGRLFDIGSGPLYAMSGDGSKLRSIDGNEYIDMICGLGAISLGYGEISAFAIEDLRDGWIYSLPSFQEPIAAEIVLEHVAPWASHVRFVKTGSEATHAAYRIARRATGREWVIIGDWSYHGWHEWCALRDDGQPERFQTQLYQHGANLDETFKHGIHPLNVDGDEIAAVFVEPHRWKPVDVKWLWSLRAFCDRVGALLVFDEMIYGGRWAIGGATEYFGVTPDLACFGKAFGNGAPIAFVVGREALAEHGELISGTYSGDAAALSALTATIRYYTQMPVINTLWTRGHLLRRGLIDAIGDCDFIVREGAPVHQRLRFLDAGGRTDQAKGRRFAALMAQRGVLWHPDVINVSAAHTESDIERVIEAVIESIKEFART